SRSARKAAYACLKVLTRDQESIWSDFLILCQCLEEPQFHLINPVLSRFDNIMQLVYSERIDFEWAMVVFTRAFAHSNGWVRLWALERLITIQPRTMAVNHDKDDFAALLWVRAHLSGQDGSLKMVIEKELADRLVNVEERFERLFSSITEAVDTLLTILFAYKEVSHGLDQLIQRYILLRCTTVSYSGHEMFMVHNVYAGIWKRLGLSFKSLVDLCLSLISEKEISVDRHCFLLRILYDAFDHLTNHEVEGVIPAILRYFGTNPLVPMEHPKSVMFRCEKDANKLFSTVHEYRLKVLIKFLPNVVRMDDEQILLRCADQLALASSYPVAQCYLEILQMFIDRVKCSNTLLVVVEAAIVLTKEEKKSQHFLPSLRSVL
ncbi:hypothetical protein Angca_000777, partial [Angiostrongylus cantonensis]